IKKSKEVLSFTSLSDSDSEVETKAKRKNPKPGGSSKGSSNGDDNMLQIGKMRNLSVRDFKSEVLIDIREDWMSQDGKMKPKKKGISLSPDPERHARLCVVVALTSLSAHGFVLLQVLTVASDVIVIEALLRDFRHYRGQVWRAEKPPASRNGGALW
uniref:Activated RNA polymerase II transcriptional coactivator p15 n=1 Tax=Acanthochromis polyacanthus TaxID=80966 RepID=A0A3Q1GJA9_9TELE